MNGNRPDSGNYLIALLLSAVVLLFWHFFFIAPMAERQKLAAERAAEPDLPAASGIRRRRTDASIR
jgi:hypothetical protein